MGRGETQNAVIMMLVPHALSTERKYLQSSPRRAGLPDTCTLKIPLNAQFVLFCFACLVPTMCKLKTKHSDFVKLVNQSSNQILSSADQFICTRGWYFNHDPCCDTICHDDTICHWKDISCQIWCSAYTICQ